MMNFINSTHIINKGTCCSVNMATAKVITALLFSCLLRASAATDNIVHPSPCHPEAPCLTLQDYVDEQSRYVNSNATFLFLEGTHYLNSEWNFDSINDLTFYGMGDATEVIISPSANISFINCRDIVIHSIKIVKKGLENDTNNSALIFSYTEPVQIYEVTFLRDNNEISRRARALYFTNTSADIQNCRFANGYIKNGGAILAYFSFLNFSGRTLFEQNTANFSGGAIYANKTELIFNGDTIFRKNRAGSTYSPTDYSIGGGCIFAWQSTVVINDNSTFVENAPIHFFFDYVLIGAAVLAAEGSSLLINGRSTFHNNSGSTGGAVFLVNSKCSLSGPALFVNNTATIRHGGAIFSYASQVLVNNSIEFRNNTAQERGGGVYLEHSILYNYKELLFTNNSVVEYGGGAVYLYNSTISISGDTDFVNNTGQYGGALEFDYYSKMILGMGNVNFLANKAENGGAINFYDTSSTHAAQCQNITIENINCSFELSTEKNDFENIRLNFTNNSANAGAAIYGGALDFCKVQVNGNKTDFTGYEVLSTISVFHHLADEDSYISSRPLKLCQCDSYKEPNCSLKNQFVNMNVVPGRTFNLSVITVGQFDMPSSSIVVTIFDSSDGSEIRSANNNRTKVCRDIEYQVFTSNQQKNFTIHPKTCNSYNGSLIVTLNVEDCPSGFQLVNNTCKCEEKLLNLFGSHDLCDIETGLIRRPGNDWLRPVYENGTYVGFQWSSACQSAHCKRSDVDNAILLNFSDFVDKQCRENRTGLLCGSCEASHSLVLSSMECDLCENASLGLIPIFAFAGIALIAVLILLQLTVAKGTIHGLILYCNVVSICQDIIFPRDEANLTPLSIFVAWINLDFGIPTCFFNGLDAYTYSWLQFIFPFYLWFLIALIIIISNFSSRIGKLFGSNPVSILATVILLSFTKLLQSSERALSHDMVINPDGSRIRVWRMDPNVDFFRGKHVVLAIFAISVIILLIVPYMLLLLFGFHLQKYSGRKGFRWFNSFKPLLDAYYASYTKRGRYWIGFMLMLRSILFLSFTTIAPLDNTNATLVTATSLFAGIIIVGWITGRVYNKLYLEILEASFIFNICVLAVTSYHIRLVGMSQLIVSYTSVGIAFAQFVSIVIFHVFLRLKGTKVALKITMYVSEICKKLLYLLRVKQHAKKEKSELEQLDSPPMPIREPLLEDATTF